jgi:hypothetical protein
MTHNLLPFKPITYNLSSETRFQNVPFQCNLQRYSAVHHVESYAARPTHARFSRGEEYNYEQATEWGAEALEAAQVHPALHNMRRMQDMLAYMQPGGVGPEMAAAFAMAEATAAAPNSDVAAAEMGAGLGAPAVGLPEGSAGGIFPYDFDLRSKRETVVQLIIGKPSKKDARRLLQSFDLEICKCSFDGRTFRVPSPADTFARCTACTSARREIVQDFFTNEESRSDCFIFYFLRENAR